MLKGRIRGLEKARARIIAAALVAASAALASGVSPAVASASAGSAAKTSAVSAALIDALPKLQCPSGTVALKPATAHLTTHGAAVYHYAIGTGPGFDYYVPPTGFKPLTASNAELAEMNLPTRPSGGARFAAWKSDMGRYKGTEKPVLCESRTPISESAGKHGRPSAGSGAVATHYGNDHWSGYVNNAGSYTEVVAHWTQQGAYTCGCSGPTDEVTWVGIGGWSTGRLLQDGTRNYSNTTPYAWFEYLGAVNVGIIQRNNTTVGDDIASAVSYSNGTANFGVTDNGTYEVNVHQGGLAGDYDPSTADFINERPVYCSTGCYHTLTNTGVTFWSSARTYSPAGEIPIGGQSVFAVVMTSDGSTQAPPCSTSSTILQYPEGLSGQNFDSQWCRAS